MESASFIVGRCAAVVFQAVVVIAAARAADWPPAPPLPAPAQAEDAVALPNSVAAEPASTNEWDCTFRFRPAGEVRKVAVAGAFNGWDREACVLKAGGDGTWSGTTTIGTGVWEYKFLVNDGEWYSDPENLERVPDGFGGFNSVVRLGRLAHMKKSQGTLGDGQIDALGLAHRPPAPLYVQPLGPDEISLRYRTFARDVAEVAVTLRDQEALLPMQPVSEGPLFTYWEARVPMPPEENPRTPKARSIEYTFVLRDGQARVCDPTTYLYTLMPSAVFDTPEWARQAIWYQVFVDRFRNGDPANDPEPVRPWTSEWFTPSAWEGQDGQTFYKYFVFDRQYGGDLAGLEAQLPYLKELGVNALYLNPIFEAPSNHKYDVENYVHVDDQFGNAGASVAGEDLLNPATWQWTATDQRFLAFVRKAHELGFKVILDGVFNHVGMTHPAFRDLQKNGRKSPYADWFDVVSWEPFDYKGWADFDHMPVLRKGRDGFASDNVKQHIFNITKRWMDPNGDGDPSDGIDGWRLDVPNDIPRPFWAEWRQFVKGINPDALITGEIWHRADQWLDGRHFDAVMNYEFAKVAVAWLFDRDKKIPASEAVARLAELRLAYPAAATYALQNLVGSHDTDRIVSMAQNPDREYDRQNRVQENNPQYDNSKPAPEAYARARLMVLLQMTYIGAPLIYYGDEVGMWGADDPTNRKPMLWQDLGPYEKPEENAVMPEQLKFYREAIALRNAHSALRDGTFETLLVDDAADVWAFVRSNHAAHLIVVLNASETPRAVQVPLVDGLPQAWQVVFNGTGAAPVADGKVAVQVPALSGVVLKSAK